MKKSRYSKFIIHCEIVHEVIKSDAQLDYSKRQKNSVCTEENRKVNEEKVEHKKWEYARLPSTERVKSEHRRQNYEIFSGVLVYLFWLYIMIFV